MMQKAEEKSRQYEFVYLEELVPADHELRRIETHFDFSFVREKVKHLYCLNNGRPGIDPAVLFKILFLGYLYGIRSERQLMREIEVNVAYRWFLGYGLRDSIPDHSTLSQNRRRRFKESDVYQEIFDEIVFMALKEGFVEGKLLYTDSTHLKANANRHKYTRVEATKTARSYLSELEAAIESDRSSHGKAPLKEREDKDKTGTDIPQRRESTTDPDSGYMCREGKPEGFFYLDHRTVDDRHNIITDVHVTSGNVYDTIPYLGRIDRQKERFGFDIEAVGLDAGYFTSDICHGLVERDIYGVVGYRAPAGQGIEGGFYKREYIYDKENDYYTCPMGSRLVYRTTTREGYREYGSDPAVCSVCTQRARCTRSKQMRKTITRHVWEDDKEQISAHRLTVRGKAIYKRRKETVERSFADAKQLHGYRYARFRGIKLVLEQCLMTAICQNIRKIVRIMAKQPNPPSNPFFRRTAQNLKYYWYLFSKLLTSQYGPHPLSF
jgi:transposase